jgi:hypothetical protein
METRQYKVYKFNELTEDQKQKVVDRYADINVDHEWYDDDGFQEDASEYGIKIDMNQISFDLDRGSYAAFDTFNHSRKVNWRCPIVIEDVKKFVKKAGIKYNGDNYISIGHNHYAGGLIKNTIETDYEEEDVLQETLNEMLDKILSSLKKSYDYLTSEEAIIETLQANDYYFTEDGKID